MGCRRVLALVHGIPINGSALGRDLYGEASTWSSAVELQAETVDLLRNLLYAWGGPKPEPVRRPHELTEQPEQSGPVTMSLTDFVAMFNAAGSGN